MKLEVLMRRSLVLLLCLLLSPLSAYADDRTQFRLEGRGGMITHRGKRLDLDVMRIRLMPEIVHRSRTGLLFHLAPTLGVTRATIGVRERIRRNVSTERLRGRITEATDGSPQTLNVPTSGFGTPSGLLPPTIAFPISQPGDPGRDIPDTLRLDLPFSAQLTVPWTPTVGFRTSLELLPDTRFRWEPYVDYEHSIGPARGTVDDLLLDVGGIGIDFSFIRGNIAVRDRWSVLTAGFRLGWMFDRWRPYLDLGMIGIRNRYDISARGTLKESLVGAKVKTRESDSFMNVQPFYTLGAEIDVTTTAFFRTEIAVVATPNTTTTYLTGGMVFRLGK